MADYCTCPMRHMAPKASVSRKYKHALCHNIVFFIYIIFQSGKLSQFLSTNSRMGIKINILCTIRYVDNCERPLTQDVCMYCGLYM